MAKESYDLSSVFLELGEGLGEAARIPNLYDYVPSDKQRAFHSDPHHDRLYIGGNRSGKSLGSTIEAIWWLTGTHPFRTTPEPPIRGRVVAVDFLNGVDKIILPLYKQWLPKTFLINGSWEQSYSKERHVLTLNNGSFVEFMSQDQDLDKFAGSSRHFIHFDEECPQSIYRECIARLVDTGGCWWMSQTPVAGMEWIFDDIYLPAKEGKKDIGVVEAEIHDNPSLSREAIQRFLDELPPEERDVRAKGQYVHLGGAVFPDFSPVTHCIPRGQFVPTPEHRIIRTMDSGYTNPTVWLWLAVAPDGTITVFKEHYAAKLTVAEHAKIVNQITKEIEKEYGCEIWLTTGDPAIKQTKEHTGTSILQEYQKDGIYISVDSIPTDRRVGLNRLNQYFKINPKTKKPFLMITDDCPHLIAELPKLKWKKWASARVAEQNNRQEDIRDKDNHCYDALKYAMTFMDDLTPEQLSGESKGGRFHDTFRAQYSPVTPLSDIDDQSSWGTVWRTPGAVGNLEG
nr:MAG TPA_asm: Large terminase protein [Caudoviricetes sp.]